MNDQSLRYELKLVCDGRWLHQARTWIRQHPANLAPTFSPRQINNIYLDTLSLDYLSANWKGSSQRFKIRLRWYGESETPDQPWLEIKRKDNLLGDKKRVQLDCALDMGLTWIEILKTVRKKAPADWQLVLQSAVQPTLFNHYRREYFATNDNVIRATIDYDQFAYDQRFSLRPNLIRPLSIENNVIIELKAPAGHEERLQEVAGNFPIPRSRNSKYANSLQTALLSQ
ncbi:MAG: polyphosphate polymerase domain-containing protein [Anaerolineales bacterium]|nr:polyphosphate polymerase domain-containing protein [Anaerolineales bacterium]